VVSFNRMATASFSSSVGTSAVLPAEPAALAESHRPCRAARHGIILVVGATVRGIYCSAQLLPAAALGSNPPAPPHGDLPLSAQGCLLSDACLPEQPALITKPRPLRPSPLWQRSGPARLHDLARTHVEERYLAKHNEGCEIRKRVPVSTLFRQDRRLVEHLWGSQTHRTSKRPRPPCAEARHPKSKSLARGADAHPSTRTFESFNPMDYARRLSMEVAQSPANVQNNLATTRRIGRHQRHTNKTGERFATDLHEQKCNPFALGP